VQTLYASVQGNARAKKWEWVGRGVGGELVGDFWDSIGNVNEINTQLKKKKKERKKARGKQVSKKHPSKASASVLLPDLLEFLS
jgi:DnaJ-domain-containing protein 1